MFQLYMQQSVCVPPCDSQNQQSNNSVTAGLNTGVAFLLTFRLLRVLCGSRVRVEMSTGLSRKGRGRPSRRQFDPNDRCYQCGDRGHYAYDCYRFSKRGGRRSR